MVHISKEDLDQYVKNQYRDASLDSPGYVPCPAPPSILFNTSPPRLQEILEVLKGVRSASAPGLDGLLYKFYKNCTQVTRMLCKLMKGTWKRGSIPAEWQQAIGIFIPNEQNSNTINQFRNIPLLNVEEKVFFSVLVRTMTNFLKENGYIDTSCQKAGNPGFPRCIQHSSIFWEQLQRAKTEQRNIHVVWLDFADAYGFVPHMFIDFALGFFYAPPSFTKIIAKYFRDFHMCFCMEDFMTGWQ